MEATQLKSIIKDFVSNSGKLVVVCLGNELRGDDAVGFIVCSVLSKTCGGRYRVVYAGQDASRVLGLALEGYDILLFDAVLAENHSPGDLVVVSPEAVSDAGELPTTHTLPLQLLRRYLRTRMLIVGVNVNPSNLELGATVSREVARAATVLAELAAEALGCKPVEASASRL